MVSNSKIFHFPEMLASRMMLVLKRWIRNDMFLRSPFLVMLSPYLRTCECVWEERCICMYTFMCLTLRTRRPVLCKTAQPIQLKFDFNLCMFLLGWAKCVCVCVFVSMLKHGLLCRDMFTFLKLWKTGGVALSLFLLFIFIFFSVFSLFVLALMGHTESHSQAAHSSCHDCNWQGVLCEKRSERQIEAKIKRDWVGCDCLTLICRQSKRRIYV